VAASLPPWASRRQGRVTVLGLGASESDRAGEQSPLAQPRNKAADLGRV